MPRLHIIDRLVNPKALSNQPKFISEPDYAAKAEKDGYSAGFLVKGYTRKVLVQN